MRYLLKQNGWKGIDGYQVRTADSLGLRELTFDFRAY